MTRGPTLEKRVSLVFEKAAPAIVVLSILATIIAGLALNPMPEFQTDLSAFAPESEADAAIERMEEVMPPSPHRIYVHIEATQDGANILELAALKQLQSDLETVNSFSSENGNFITSHINAAQILQVSLDERDNQQRNLSEFNNWEELLEAIVSDEECTDAIGEDRAIATASFARSVMLHSDFDYEPICNWLENGHQGDPTPSASSTMWIIEISGELSPDERLQRSVELRQILEENAGKEGSALHYGVVSDDLVSYDINESTLDNLVWLLILSILVVVLVLALAFRSIMMVAAPLLGLTAALVWTYGIRALAGSDFSILEVAVAPVVLGLGIDYSIHLQRAYEKAREDSDSPAEAWVRSFSILRLALTLSVVTTAFAFLANFLSPLPPLKSFGLTLALGVVSAFVASTVTVGALHVLVEKTTGNVARRSLEFPGFTNMATEFQRRHTAIILLAVAGLTLSSVLVSVGQLDTKFELTDFLGEEMEVIEVRNSMYDSYEVEALKSVDILIEPSSGMDALTGERDLLKELERLDNRLAWTTNVVTPEGTDTARPSYDGIYPILRDAIENDQTFGEMYNLGVFDGAVGVTGEFSEGDLALAIGSLLENDTIGEPIRGQTWGERTSSYVALTEDGNALRFLRMRIDVTAGNSEESSGLANQFKEFEQDLEDATGARVHLSGDLILVHNVLSGLVISQVESTAFSLAVSLIVLVSLTRRFGPSLVVILPVGLAGTWVVGAMAVLDINWNVLTVMITALTIGLGIDYSIHVWRKFESNRDQGMGTWASMRDMYSTTGAALIMSAGTTICGFMVLLLSPVPVIKDFGLVSSISVAFSLILALLVLPGLLAAEVRKSNSD
jgi:predicted RND superfamily exporter protein|tara:strand:+ start:91 stop:2643 length:2553 start_codon:yes stop_codon:yes gene_type:complete